MQNKGFLINPPPWDIRPSIYTIKYYHAPKMINVLNFLLDLRFTNFHPPPLPLSETNTFCLNFCRFSYACPSLVPQKRLHNMSNGLVYCIFSPLMMSSVFYKSLNKSFFRFIKKQSNTIKLFVQ